MSQILKCCYVTFLEVLTYNYGLLNFQNMIPVSGRPFGQTEDNRVLQGLLSNLLSNGYITSISEDQKHALQGLYSKLHEDWQTEQQSKTKVEKSSLSTVPKKSTTT